MDSTSWFCFQIKEYQLAVDYCAFMVAILLARHVADQSNAVVQCKDSAGCKAERLGKLVALVTRCVSKLQKAKLTT